MKTTRTTTRDAAAPDDLERMVHRFPDLDATSARRWMAAGETLGRFMKVRKRAAPVAAAAPARVAKMAEAM